MATLEPSAINEFFERYQKHTLSQVEEFQADFNTLKIGFSRIHEEVIDEALKTAPAFNVFSVLGLSRDEARTHSAMLAQLLKPDGSHGQQHLFLSSFLEYCAEKYPDFPLPSEDINSGHWIIRNEMFFSEGRMDIVIQSPDLNCLFVIENKIDASEQEKQLFRYGKWMKSESSNYPSQALIFLTIRGDVSISSSGTPYFRLSYHVDITNWLNNILTKIQAPNVREVVRQYKLLIKKL